MQAQQANRGVATARSGAGSLRLAMLSGLAGIALAVLAACQPIIRDHGYAPTEAELATLEIGRDTRETVNQKVGRPSAEGLLNDDAWFFVQSRWQQIGPRAPVETERQVVVISFNEGEGGTLRNVERFGLEDGHVVVLSRRVTESNIQGVTVIGQLLGNIGRMRADQIVQ